MNKSAVAPGRFWEKRNASFWVVMMVVAWRFCRD